MGKHNDVFVKKVKTPSTAVPFSVGVGYYPDKVEVINLKNARKMTWYRGMPDDSAIVEVPVAATAAVGTVAASEDNEGSGTSPAMAGTYTGGYTGNLVMTCVLKGNMATAKFDAVFPDGSEVKGWVTGASNSAKEVGQGVTFKLTSGSGDDCAVGDVYTSALTAGGNSFGVPVNGITVGFVDVFSEANGVLTEASGKMEMGIKVGLNTSVNVLSNELIIVAS